MAALRMIIYRKFLGQSVLMSFFNFHLAMKSFLNMVLMAQILRLLLGQTDMFGKECCCVHALQPPAATKVPVKSLQANKTCLL